MKIKTSFSAGVGAAVVWVMCVAGLANASTIFVDADAAPGGDGVSWGTAFHDLQDALAVATYGDEIWLAEGTYRPGSAAEPDLSFELVDGVGIFGGFAGVENALAERDFGLHQTILSGDLGTERSLHVLVGVGLGPDTLLDGVVVTKGAAPRSWQSSFPGGGGLALRESSPLVRDVVFEFNQSREYAGAVFIEGGAVRFERTVFRENTCEYVAGALRIEDADVLFTDCQFTHNFASIRAGAFWAGGESDIAFLGSVFRGNYSDDVSGALDFQGNSLTLQGVTFVDNVTGRVGASAVRASGSVVISDCEFIGNRPTSVGVYDWSGPLSLGDGNSLVVNSVFHSNSERVGAISAENCLVSIMNCTFANNVDYYDGSTVYAFSGAQVEIVNSILWGNLSSHGTPVVGAEAGSVVRLSHSLVQASNGSGPAWDSSLGIDLGGNLDTDPRFLVPPTSWPDPLESDLHIILTSPAIDAGTDPTPYLPSGTDFTSDLDGAPRISGIRIDMGAYEYQFDTCPLAQVEIGDSWDGLPLQEVLDAQYGPGTIAADSDYSGYNCADPVEAYWLDSRVDAWLVKEIASNRSANRFGWYREGDGSVTIDGSDDGPIFDGPLSEGSVAILQFDAAQRFGFYLDPNGDGDATNAPQPEVFFSNRVRNDAGPSGEGATHQPSGGDVQCLIYDISHLRGGVPTYVLAWEDLDAGSPASPTYSTTTTDNDYNDLVVEIRAESPVAAVVATLEAFAVAEGVKLRWALTGASGLVRFEIQRRRGAGAFETIGTVERVGGEFEWVDRSVGGGGRMEYRIAVQLEAGTAYSQAVAIETPPLGSGRTGLVRAVPNPFNPSTQIEYAVVRAAQVQLRVFDLAGRLVRDFDLGEQQAGVGHVDWDGRDDAGSSVASGVYVVRMQAAGESDALRVVLLK